MTTVTKAHAKFHGLPPQAPDESDYNFRHRVAGALRDLGKVMEAHEAQQDARWDDPERGEDVVGGVLGAMVQALQGVDYHVHGEQQVGCDIVAGALVDPRHLWRPRGDVQAAGFATIPAPVTVVPETLQGIYTSCGPWEDWSPRDGYRKKPCMIQHLDGRVLGPCWPNAGKFSLIDGYGQWHESGIVRIAYFIDGEVSSPTKP